MLRTRSRLLSRFYFIICFISLYISSECEKMCNVNILHECEIHWKCVQRNVSGPGICQCERGYELINGQCESISSTEHPMGTTNASIEQKNNSGGGSVAAGLLIPTFLILFGIAIYYGARRYKCMHKIRQLRENPYGNVLVTRDETDDDDPPIA